jgi:hypothetical protein
LRTELQIAWYSNVSDIQMLGIKMFTVHLFSLFQLPTRLVKTHFNIGVRTGAGNIKKIEKVRI